MFAGRLSEICGTTLAAYSFELTLHKMTPFALSRSAMVHDVVATDSDRLIEALTKRESALNEKAADFTVNTGRDSVAATADCSTMPVVATTDVPLMLVTGSDALASTRVVTGFSIRTVWNAPKTIVSNVALPDSILICDRGIKIVFNSEVTGSQTFARTAMRSDGSSSFKISSRKSLNPKPEGRGIESDMGAVNSASLDGRMMTVVPAAVTELDDASARSARVDDPDRSLPSSTKRFTAMLRAPGGKMADVPLMAPVDAEMAWA